MKMKGRKATVFFINFIILVLFFLLLIFYAPDILSAGIGHTIIGAIVGNGITFIYGNCKDKLTISQHYRKELDDNVEQN